MKKQTLAMIVASTPKGEIGVDNTLPWRLKGDLKRFKDLTLDQVVIMGRKTYESLPVRPLVGRVNIVVTSKADEFRVTQNVVRDLYYVDSLSAAIKLASTFPATTAYVMGGAQLYAEAMPLVDVVELTLVSQVADRYDTVIPNFKFRTQDWQIDLGDLVEYWPEGCPIPLTSHIYLTLTRKTGSAGHD